MGRRCLVAAVLIVAAGCTGGKHEIAARDVNAVSWMSFPGAIAPIVKVGDPSWPKIANALPAVLPTPPNQPRECRAGGITTLWIARGNSQIVYGPCRVPASIAALHRLIPDPATDGPRACKATPPTPTSD